MASSGVTFTNDDASNCKRYAVYKNYWKDDFLQHFVRNVPEKKAPEISRGYYLRHRCIQTVIQKFLQFTNRECQIVILGAGFETLYWNLYLENIYPKFGIYEIDLPPVVQRKCFYIKSKAELKNCLVGETILQKDFISSSYYKLSIADISQIESIEKTLKDLDKSKPTLFLAECVLVYLKIEHSEKLMDYISKTFPSVVYLEYDPICLNDRFGEVMKENLHRRQSDLFGAHPDIKSKEMFFKSFYSNVDTKLLYDIYKSMPPDELERISKIEFLDEIELLTDLLKHYAISVCSNGLVMLDLLTINP